MIFFCFSSAPAYCFSSAAPPENLPLRRSSSVRALPERDSISNSASVNCARSAGVMEPIHSRRTSSLSLPIWERCPRWTNFEPTTFQERGSCCMTERLALSITA